MLEKAPADDTYSITKVNGNLYITGSLALKGVLFDKQSFFSRDTGLTRWNLLKERFNSSELNLFKSLGRHSATTNSPNFLVEWPAELSETALAVSLLRFFLSPFSDKLEDELLVRFHNAGKYFENTRSGKVVPALHLMYFHQQSRELLSRAIYDQLSPSNREHQDEKLLSAVIHSAYRSLLNLLGWSMFFLSEPIPFVDDLYAEKDANKQSRDIRLFLYETMRLFPSAWVLHRKVEQLVIINSLQLNKGEDVYIPILSFHRSETFFLDSMCFEPYRFLKKDLNPWVYLPFGRGEHSCPGANAGLTIAQLFVYHLVSKGIRLQRKQIQFEPDSSIPISLNPFFTFEFSSR